LTRQVVWNVLPSTRYCGEHIFSRRNSRSGEFRKVGERVVAKLPRIVPKEDFDMAVTGDARIDSPATETNH